MASPLRIDDEALAVAMEKAVGLLRQGEYGLVSWFLATQEALREVARQLITAGVIGKETKIDAEATIAD